MLAWLSINVVWIKEEREIDLMVWIKYNVYLQKRNLKAFKIHLKEKITLRKIVNRKFHSFFSNNCKIYSAKQER